MPSRPSTTSARNTATRSMPEGRSSQASTRNMASVSESMAFSMIRNLRDIKAHHRLFHDIRLPSNRLLRLPQPAPSLWVKGRLLRRRLLRNRGCDRLLFRRRLHPRRSRWARNLAKGLASDHGVLIVCSSEQDFACLSVASVSLHGWCYRYISLCLFLPLPTHFSI